jgi:hypothetical protein
MKDNFEKDLTKIEEWIHLAQGRLEDSCEQADGFQIP